MSIKIYGGLKAVDSNPLVIAERIRAVTEPLFEQRFAAFYKAATGAIGKPWNEAFPLLHPNSETALWQEPIPEFALSRAKALYDHIEALRTSMERSFSPLDFSYEIMILPNGNGMGSNNQPLAMVFSESDRYRKALMKAGVLVDYGYWDNSDEPDNVTRKQWKRRRQAWSPLLGGKTPSEVGLLIQPPIKFTIAWKQAKGDVKQ